MQSNAHIKKPNTACKIFAAINTKALICAVFKNATDCAIIDNPPNCNKKDAMGRVILLTPAQASVFNPDVVSNNPKVKALLISLFLKIILKNDIIGFNAPKENKISVNK